jgi:hypothetical protein
VKVQDWGQTLKLVRFVFCYKGHRHIGMTLSQQIPIRLKLDLQLLLFLYVAHYDLT